MSNSTACLERTDSNPSTSRSTARSEDKTIQDLKIEHTVTKTAITKLETYSQEDDYPDGGLRAWIIVFGTMCITFSTFGFVNAWGVFQAYYEATLLKNHSPSAIAWIGSIQYSLVFLPGLITGRMFDLGYFKIPFFVASFLLVAATFLIAECTQYWHFLLCQGFAVGIGCGAIFGPSLGVISHWFQKRRGIALGLTAFGSSIGGTIFPIAVDHLIPQVGFKWTTRILGFILILTLGCANLAVKRRLPPVNASGGLVNLAAFKNPAYTLYCLSGFVAFLGLYTVLTYMDVSAIFVGIDPGFSFYLVSIVNATSGFGRLFSGILSDRVGPINIMIPFTMVAGMVTYLWPFMTTKVSLIAVAVFYGLASGAFISLCTIPVMAFGEVSDVGRRVGMAMTIAATGALIGSPISGGINNATHGFKAVGYYAGSTIVVSVALMVATRQLHLKQTWGKF